MSKMENLATLLERLKRAFTRTTAGEWVAGTFELVYTLREALHSKATIEVC
jgi:hypothetical protein